MDHLTHGPLLDAYRLAQRKEHLMAEYVSLNETRPTTNARRPRVRGRRLSRRQWGIAVMLAVTLGGVGTVAVANGNAVFRQKNGVVGIDAEAVKPVYHGKVVDADELQRLQRQHRAMFSAVNRELACQGITLYFDTDAELNTYLAGYQQRHAAAVAAEHKGTTNSNPCVAYASSPRFAQP